MSIDVVAAYFACFAFEVNGVLTSNASGVWRAVQFKEGRLVGTSLVDYIKAPGSFEMH